jgi:hypothetical protein
VTAAETFRDRRFFFVHLQKTAGTTLFRRLKQQFGAAAVYPTPEYQGDVDSVIGVDLLVERFAKHRDEIRVVTGHFPLCTEELLDADFVPFTLLREPVSRTLSFLRHQRQVAPEFANTPLEEIYDRPLMRDGLVRNHMVRMLSLTVDEMTDGMLTQVDVDDARVERAKAQLVDRIDLFGVQEHFDEFCDLLAQRYGWTLGPMHHANRTEPVDVPESLLHSIAADNAADAELYRFAAEEWSRRT